MSITHPNSCANVHRFRDLVATTLPGMGETVYLSAAEAQAYARALNRAARSVESESFIKSSVGSISIPIARTDRFRDL